MRRPFDHPAGRECKEEGDHDGQGEIVGRHLGCIASGQGGAHINGVGTNSHEFAMGHVDDPHLTKDDGQPQAHQEQHSKQA